MKLTKRDLMTLAVAVILPVAAYFVHFRQSLSRLGELARRQVELQAQADGEYKTTQDVTLARNNLRKLEQRMLDYMGCVTAQGEANKAVDMILRGAKDAGVGIELIKPGAMVEGAMLGYVPIQLTATAEFPKLYQFLRGLERERTMITVNRMELESEPTGGKRGVRLELRIYFMKGEAASAKGAQA